MTAVSDPTLREQAERAEHHPRRKALDPFAPNAVFVERERSHTGEGVDVANILLRNGECPWRCLYCDLWKTTTPSPVPRGAILAQLDFGLQQPGVASARQIKLYNAGSFFDPGAIPQDEYPEIAARLRRFERVIVECHPSLVPCAVAFRPLIGSSTLEVAMGLEVADDSLLARLQRRMTLEQFRTAATLLLRNGIAVRAFVMVKPPYVRSDAEALRLANQSSDFAFECGADPVTLIPSRFGPAALDVLAASGDFGPPQLATVESALEHGLASGRGRTFVDLWDAEKLGGCTRCRPLRVQRLEQINFNQQAEKRVHCGCGG